MRENELVSQRQAEIMFDDLNQRNVKKFAVLGIQSASLSEATQIEVTTVITRIVNSRNYSKAGVMKGISHKNICEGFDINHIAAHKALVQEKYVEGKQVTIAGFEKANGAGVINVDYYNDIPLFYFTDEGSLYWNDLHENFKTFWDELMLIEVNNEAIGDTVWNKALKERNPAMSVGFMRMLQRNNIKIMKDGKEITV